MAEIFQKFAFFETKPLHMFFGRPPFLFVSPPTPFLDGREGSPPSPSAYRFLRVWIGTTSHLDSGQR
jgi:hypothetical protein